MAELKLLKRRQTADPPTSPVAFIVFEGVITHEEDFLALSPECSTKHEIAHYADSMIKQLNQIKAEAAELFGGPD